MDTTLGGMIRSVRKQQGMTLRELSARSGLSVSQLSKLENGKQRISVDLALKLAGVLKVPVTTFLSPLRQMAQARRAITRAGEGLVHEAEGLTFEVLCNDIRDKANLFWRVTVRARTPEEAGGWRSHAGQEFLHVLSGSLELHTGQYEPLLLHPGDSILFDGEMEHAYVCVGDGPAVVLMSNATIRQNAVALDSLQGRDD
ncbi:MAG: helix-turn-helix domain-containing protein [Pararhodobacter sp.]|nr:helix-turn-helix domain-containing protein [Pararhodobacter sp.]